MGETGILKCTVFNAATSQPRVCITKAAIVLPTYLLLDQNTRQEFAQAVKDSIPIDDLRKTLAICTTAGIGCAYMTCNGQHFRL